MALEISMVGLVLLAAILHATWNALIKSSGERMVAFGVITMGGSLLALTATFFVDFPNPESWGYIAASVIVHYLYFAFLLLSYRVGDLSHVYPISRGIAPLLVALGGYVFVGETLSFASIVGICIASLGIMSLAFERGLPRGDNLQPVVFALGTGFFIACYTVIDGAGVRLAGDRLGYIFWMFSFEGLPFVIWMIFWPGRGRDVLNFIKRKPLFAFGGSLFSITAYGLVIFAMSAGTMAHVSALRETSTILAAIIGVVILKETLGIRRIVAAGFVAAGVIVMNIW